MIERTIESLYGYDEPAEMTAVERAAYGYDEPVLDFTPPSVPPPVDVSGELLSLTLGDLFSGDDFPDVSAQMAEYEKIRGETGVLKSEHSGERTQVEHSLVNHGRRTHLVNRACLDGDRGVFTQSGLVSDAAVTVVYKSLVAGLQSGDLFPLESSGDREVMIRKLRMALA